MSPLSRLHLPTLAVLAVCMVALLSPAPTLTFDPAVVENIDNMIDLTDSTRENSTRTSGCTIRHRRHHVGNRVSWTLSQSLHNMQAVQTASCRNQQLMVLGFRLMARGRGWAGPSGNTLLTRCLRRIQSLCGWARSLRSPLGTRGWRLFRAILLKTHTEEISAQQVRARWMVGRLQPRRED